MYKLSKNHLELFKLATNLDKSKKFDLSDHIYELMTRISQTEEPPINLLNKKEDFFAKKSEQKCNKRYS